MYEKVRPVYCRSIVDDDEFNCLELESFGLFLSIGGFRYGQCVLFAVPRYQIGCFRYGDFFIYSIVMYSKLNTSHFSLTEGIRLKSFALRQVDTVWKIKQNLICDAYSNDFILTLFPKLNRETNTEHGTNLVAASYRFLKIYWNPRFYSLLVWICFGELNTINCNHGCGIIS